MKKQLYPCLWFDGQAKVAAEFYCSTFPNSKIINDLGMVVHFEIDGQFIMALNGGDNFKFNEAVSFVIPCKDQNEIDFYWDRLTSEGGKESQCGWCRDKFGLWWQVVPELLEELMTDQEKAPKVVNAFMKMKKFDIETLKEAADS